MLLENVGIVDLIDKSVIKNMGLIIVMSLIKLNMKTLKKDIKDLPVGCELLVQGKKSRVSIIHVTDADQYYLTFGKTVCDELVSSELAFKMVKNYEMD